MISGTDLLRIENLSISFSLLGGEIMAVKKRIYVSCQAKSQPLSVNPAQENLL